MGSLRLLTACALVAGCAASQPRTERPRTELVIDEAAVVRVPRPGGAGDRALPALPQPLADSSRAFQRGFALARELMQAPGPSAPDEQDPAAAQRWLDGSFKPWLEQRLHALVSLVETFADITPEGGVEPPHEHVVAVAMLGLANGRIYDQLMSIPPPAAVRSDPALLSVYQSELQTTLAGGLLEAAIMAHRQCAMNAAAQRELSFGPWLELCEEQLALRSQQQQAALALREQVRAEREAERRAAEGERPPGPDVCWTPVAPAGAAGGAQGEPAQQAERAAATEQTAQTQPPPPPADSAPARAETPAVAPRQRASAQRCGLEFAESDPLGGRALSPRDLRYGARDPETGVRVSAALADNPTMDARPLGWLATQTGLARCFDKHVPESQPVTISVHASLSIDARGRTRSVALTPEPSDSAAPPSKVLARCLQRALAQTAFTCSPTGQPTQASATFCLRRD